jgi:hypothetical protein
MTTREHSIDELVFVYDADGTLAGEARYWFGTLFGADHCSLCDLTHSRWGKRRDFAECANRLGIPIAYHHRDDVTADLRALTGAWPCVIGRANGAAEAELVVLLSRDDLTMLHGDLAGFEAALRRAINEHDPLAAE